MARKTTGIVERHARGCASRNEGKCNCSTTYEAWVWSASEQRKVSKTFPTISAAKGWRTDAAHAKRKGTLRSPTRQTLREFAEAWLAGAKAGSVLKRSGERYKPAVIRGYEADLRRYVLDDLGAHRLSALRRRDLQALVDRLVADGRSASKVHNVLMPVRAICRYAIERDEIEVNPTTNLRLPMPTGSRDRTVTPQEAEGLLAALPEDARALWSTAFYAGLRRGELRGLRWSDIDLDGNAIAVERGWDEQEGPVAPKSAK